MVLRTSGGVYEDIMREAVYDPFTRATGIEVVTVAATTPKLMTMVRSGQIEIDVLDTGDLTLTVLERMAALEPIAYDRWTFTPPDEIAPELRLPTRVGCYLYASVLGYSREAFPQRHPQGWAQFWDVKAFPGPRMLADQGSGLANLEFALLADGVPRGALYPLDVERAFRSLSRIRPAIRKFWETGALSAQMLGDREVAAGSIWSGTLQPLIDGGAPLAIDWTENMIQVQAYGVLKGARNAAAAQRFVDFASQARPQAQYGAKLRYGPANARSYAMMPKAVADAVPGGPVSAALGFRQDAAWWAEHRPAVSRRWQDWIRA